MIPRGRKSARRTRRAISSFIKAGSGYLGQPGLESPIRSFVQAGSGYLDVPELEDALRVFVSPWFSLIRAEVTHTSAR